jgi:hypothetical protein
VGRLVGEELVVAVLAVPVVRQIGGPDEVDAFKVERLGAAVAADEVSISSTRRAVVVIFVLREMLVNSQ